MLTITFDITRLESLLGICITNGIHCYIENLLTILMKLYNRKPSFTIFLSYIKARMKTKSLLALWKDKFGIYLDLLQTSN